MGEANISCGRFQKETAVDKAIGTFYEFFAGGGMARAGLGSHWRCVFANDFDHKKSAVYRDNWGDDILQTEDIRRIEASDLPAQADLAWASFPCQDLSLAGGGAGLKGDRSGTFWPFWSLMGDLVNEGRPPRMVVLENVCGALTSHQGKDFAAIGAALCKAGYRYGALVIDAALFTPQSRPRLFVVAVREDEPPPAALMSDCPMDPWHTRAVQMAHKNLSRAAKNHWVWWRLPTPPPRTTELADHIEDQPAGVDWHSTDETRRILDMMSEVNQVKVDEAKNAGRRIVGAVYKRTRRDKFGRKAQRAEVRFDGVAGCLRTPAGGSSRQSIMLVHGETVKTRLLSAREAARLMGLPDTYRLPQRYNEAYHLAGDGIVVPVVRHLAAHLLEPHLLNPPQSKTVAA